MFREKVGQKHSQSHHHLLSGIRSVSICQSDISARWNEFVNYSMDTSEERFERDIIYLNISTREVGDFSGNLECKVAIFSVFQKLSNMCQETVDGKKNIKMYPINK